MRRNRKFWGFILVLVLSVMCIPGCKQAGFNVKSALKTVGAGQAGLLELVRLASENGVSTSETLRALDERLVNVKNNNMNVYSFYIQDAPVVAMIHRTDDAAASVEAFTEILNATAGDIARNKGVYYISYDPNGENAMFYFSSPSNHVFNMRGIEFSGLNAMDEGEENEYTKAFQEIVKKKRGVNTLTDWDYYMYWNRFDEDGPDENGYQFESCVLGPQAFVNCSKLDLDLFLDREDPSNVSNVYYASQLFSVIEEREDTKNILSQSAAAGMATTIGIVWFNQDGQRVMAELLSKNKETGELEREIKWYNGYSLPGTVWEG